MKIFCARKLNSVFFSGETLKKSFEVHQHILEMVYRGLVESILSFNVVTLYGNITVKNKARLARIVNTASDVIGHDQRQLSSLYSVVLKRKAT